MTIKIRKTIEKQYKKRNEEWGLWWAGLTIWLPTDPLALKPVLHPLCISEQDTLLGAMLTKEWGTIDHQLPDREQGKWRTECEWRRCVTREEAIQNLAQMEKRALEVLRGVIAQNIARNKAGAAEADYQTLFCEEKEYQIGKDGIKVKRTQKETKTKKEEQ